MKLRKTWILCLTVALCTAMAVGGTLAYLSDSVADVNVMTLGSVHIKQHELQRVDNTTHTGTLTQGGLEAFQQDQPIYPAVPKQGEENPYTAEPSNLLYWGPYVTAEDAGNGLWDDHKLANVRDKMIFVENTGKSDAFYRTFLAFECPEGMEYSQGPDKEFMMNINGHDLFDWEELGYITVDDGRYLLMCATYQQALKPGEISRPSLLQVVLTHNATNEDMELLGDSYEILALSQAVQAAGFPDAKTALDAAFNDGAALSLAKAEDWFEGVKDDYEAEQEANQWSTWTGESDRSWYNDTATEFVLTTADQLAGLAELVDEGNTFAGKTVKMGINMDMKALDENGEQIPFDPIGSYRKEKAFKGIFDGQDKTIKNMSQNTWALDNGYAYDDLGLGLFGKVEDATIKNLVMDDASISGESAICGTVAATAYGECTFENITVKNSEVADYQYYAGGIVGWASGDHKYINCDVDASTTIAAQWGDFDNSVGGVIGGAGGSATILLKDCNVACRIDAYNDVTSSYQWYAYRRCGMLIGNPGKTKVVGDTTYANAPQLTCENVTVTYDDWANYTYCEFAGKSWPYVRVQAGVSNSAYSNPRYGHPTDANGKEVVDDNHVHNEGEDHFIECTFDQLYGGGQGVYGQSTHDGVTVVYNNR